jgi:glucosamine 6-phosphate synthetase-like amidotransferase/phosphosugar isomerase protein
MTMGVKMLSDITRIPAVISALAARHAEVASFAETHLRPDDDGLLYVYGCGDGLVAAECVADEKIVARTALDFLVYDVPRLTPGDRVLAVSMSGNVDRGVEGARAALARGMRLAILTNGDAGQLGATGAPLLSLDIPPIKQFLCGTSTYLGTLFSLLLIKASISRDPMPVIPKLDQLVVDSLAVIEKLDAKYTGVRFLSAGVNRATAAHGAEKLVEVTGFPTWSADIEEFAHSQFWSADPGELIVYLAANPAVAALATHSAGALRDMGFSTLAITTPGCQVPSAHNQIVVPEVAEQISPLVLAVPLQVLAWHLACASGLDPDFRAHLKDDALRFTTSRRLTRGALVGTGR